MALAAKSAYVKARAALARATRPTRCTAARNGSEKSKTSIGGGGQGGKSDSPPAPVHMPIELERAMEQHVQKAALAEGDRALPQAGLIYFEYRGKTQNIHSLELIYTGPAGKATLTLQP